MSNEKKSWSMSVIFGCFALLIGILFDDLTTLILYLKGYGVLESNPLALAVNVPIMLMGNLIFYIFMATGFWWVTKQFRKSCIQKVNFSKYYDLFVFLFCVVIVLITFVKINIGFDHISLLSDVTQLDLLKQTSLHTLQVAPGAYYNSMNAHYAKYLTFSYWEVIFITMLSMLLFKLDNRVRPWFVWD